MEPRHYNKNKSAIFERPKQPLELNPQRAKSYVRNIVADDLPDITTEKMQKLAKKWRMGEARDAIPIRIIINAVREHLDEMNPYFQVLKKAEQTWYENWRLLYDIAHKLDLVCRYSAETRIYSVPVELVEQEAQAERDLRKGDIEWEDLKYAYSTEIDRRQAEILEIEKKIALIQEINDVATLSSYDLCNKNKISKKKSAGFFSSFCGCCHCCNNVDESDLQDPDAIKDLREHLLLEYRDNLVFKTKSLQEYADDAPPKPMQYRQALNDIKAKIYHLRIDFYRCQSKEAMLQCIRLYTVAMRLYYQIYGESPVVDSKPGIQKIIGDSDAVIANVKALFKQMIRGMRGHLSLLYCLQPNRVSFTTYLENFNLIKDQGVRDALLSGKENHKILSQLFVDYELPDREPMISNLHPKV